MPKPNAPRMARKSQNPAQPSRRQHPNSHPARPSEKLLQPEPTGLPAGTETGRRFRFSNPGTASGAGDSRLDTWSSAASTKVSTRHHESTESDSQEGKRQKRKGASDLGETAKNRASPAATSPFGSDGLQKVRLSRGGHARRRNPAPILESRHLVRRSD